MSLICLDLSLLAGPLPSRSGDFPSQLLCLSLLSAQIPGDFHFKEHVLVLSPGSFYQCGMREDLIDGMPFGAQKGACNFPGYSQEDQGNLRKNLRGRPRPEQEVG